MRYAELIDQPCSISRPLAILGDRWTFLIVKQAFGGIRRFEDFHTTLGISRSRLTDRLGRLVEHGILRREPYGEGGGRMAYRLTAKGHDLYPVLIAIRDWGDRHMAPDGPPIRYLHDGCTGEAHAHVICDACGEELTARDVRPAPGPGALVDAEG